MRSNALAAIGLCVVGWLAIRDVGAQEVPSAAEVVARLQGMCDVWIKSPPEKVQSLEYAYQLGNSEEQIELVRGDVEALPEMWIGTTLYTGLHQLVRNAERFQITAARVEPEQPDDATIIRLTVRPKGDQRMHLHAGNGISGSWRGYYSHGSKEMQLDLDAKTLLPIREKHELSEFRYRDWMSVGEGKWIPRQIDVHHDSAVFRMHFDWHAESVWLLSSADTEYQGRSTTIARVSNVVVNNRQLIEKAQAKRRLSDDNRSILRTMLEHNRPWLQPQSSFETLRYDFHIIREDIKETCAVRRDQTAVFELTHDGQGKMAEQLGNRHIILPDGTAAHANKASRYAHIAESSRKRSEPSYHASMLRFALIGCQLDLPLFELASNLNDTKVEMVDGEWNGIPCHVATVQIPRAYLGCGTMLGFSSWSYVHHLWPQFEVIYIDKERHVPIHEEFYSRNQGQRFEIDFEEYTEVSPGQWAPLRIEITSKDYFTSNYEFQLIDNRHWLMRSVESWFKPEEKSRGVIENVRIDQPSPQLDEALQQVQAYKELFKSDPVARQTVDVRALPFELGKANDLGPVRVLFTLDEKGALILRCTSAQNATDQFAHVILLDDQDRLVHAGSAQFTRQDDEAIATIKFGKSPVLATVTRFVLAGPWESLDDPSGSLRKIRALPLASSGSKSDGRGVADASGKSQVVAVSSLAQDRGTLNVKVDLASHDRMNEFQLDLPVACFNDQGHLVGAGTKSDKLLVRSHVVDAQWDVPVSAPADQKSTKVAVGLSRGQTISGPMGSTWGTYYGRDEIFTVDRLLAADDPACWKFGLQQLEADVRQILRRGYFDDARDWQEQVEENKTHRHKLQAYVARLLEIAAEPGNEQNAAAICRLLGWSQDERAIPVLKQFVNHEQPDLQQAAAVALGLIRDGSALDQIDACISRQRPAEYDRDFMVHPDDAIAALVLIRSPQSIELVRKWLDDYASRLATTPEPDNRTAGSTYSKLKLLAALIGREHDSAYLELLMQSFKKIGMSDNRYAQAAQNDVVQAILAYGEASQTFAIEQVRQADLRFLYGESKNAAFVPAVKEILTEELAPHKFHQVVGYLWNVGTPEAVALLQDAFNRDLPRGEGRGDARLYLCQALAYHRIDIGLPEAYSVLVEAANPGEPPNDEAERRKWNKTVDDRREDALDVFERADTKQTAQFLEAQTGTTMAHEQLAVLQILESMRKMPSAVRPAIQSWSSSSDPAIAQKATALLIRN